MLEGLAQSLEVKSLPQIIMFGDKHGQSRELERILLVAKEAITSEQPITIIGHGDYFDRGDQNQRNWEILQELIDIDKQFSHIEVVLLMGNHDVWCVQAMLFKNKSAKENWFLQGGKKVFDELGRKKTKELAFWITQNLDLCYQDAWGFLHVHAGIPMDDLGNPTISREQLDEMHEDIQRARDKPELLEKALEQSSEIFWVREHEWLNHIDNRVQLDEENKQKSIRIVSDSLKRQYPGMPEDVLAAQTEKLWKKILQENLEVFKQQGVKFNIQENELQIDVLDLFLAQLGAVGVIVGHSHRKKLYHIDGRIFIIDVDQGDPGHLIFNSQQGIVFDSLIRKSQECVIGVDSFAQAVEQEIDRIRQII